MSKHIVEKFQCPGCVVGGDTNCGKFETGSYGSACTSHAAGTAVLGVAGTFYLGLPKGFNRSGPIDWSACESSNNVRIWAEGEAQPDMWNKFNVAVWAMEHEGYLLVRTYLPRINMTFIDIVEGGKREELVPDAVDVSEFADEID